MSTFSESVAAFSGTISDTDKLPIWLSDGVRDVIMRISLLHPEQLPRFAVEKTIDDTTGYTATNGGIVISVYTANGVSQEVSATERFHVLNSNSIKRATDLFPKHWILNGVYFVSANGATVDGKASVVEVYRTIAASDSAITNFATEYEYLVSIYAGIQNIINKLNITSLPTEIALPTVDLGGDISLTPFTATSTPPDAVIAIIDEGEIEDFGDVPVFVPPTLDLSPVPSIDPLSLPAAPNLDFTLSKNLTTAVKATMNAFPAFSLPTKPTISEITFADVTPPTAPAAPSFTTVTIASPTPPVYTPATNTLNISTALSQIETNINTTEDLEIAVTNLQKVTTLVNDYVAKTNDAVNAYNAENAEFQGELQINIEEARLLNTKESGEYAAKLQKFSIESSAYAAQINALVNIYTANNVQYKVGMWQTESQMVLATFQAQLSAVLNQYSSDIQNNTTFTADEVKLFSTEMSEKAQKNQDSLALYTSQANSAIQKWNLTEVQQKQQQWISERNTELNKFQLDIQSAWNSFNEENVRYQAAIQKNIKEADNRQTASIETVKAAFQNLAIQMEQYKIAIDIEIQSWIQVVGSEITEWSHKRTTLLQKFATEMNGWVQNYQVKIQAYAEERATLIARLAALSNQYEKAWVPVKEVK